MKNSYYFYPIYVMEVSMAERESLPKELILEFVIAGHGDLPKVKKLLAEHPALLNASYPWSENDHETALQAAAQVASVPIAEYLLEQGAPLDICSAAMLGRTDDIRRLLDENPALIQARGAHGIPLMAYAAMSGNIELARMLWERGAQEGTALALGSAVEKGQLEMTRWLLQNTRPDLGWKNYQGKTALAIARERGDQAAAALLQEHGAS